MSAGNDPALSVRGFKTLWRRGLAYCCYCYLKCMTRAAVSLKSSTGTLRVINVSEMLMFNGSRQLSRLG